MNITKLENFTFFIFELFINFLQSFKQLIQKVLVPRTPWYLMTNLYDLHICLKSFQIRLLYVRLKEFQSQIIMAQKEVTFGLS